jgi:hypothetical protein
LLLDEGEQADKERQTHVGRLVAVLLVPHIVPETTTRPVGTRALDRHVLKGRVIVVECQPNVLEVVATTHSTSGFARGLHGRKKQAHQNTDDCDNHQQFDERKSGSISFHVKIPNTEMGKVNA